MNSGQSIAEFIERVRTLHPGIRVVVVANVVQQDALAEEGVLKGMAAKWGGWTLVALRTSENKYKGVGGTDTGHRLFNTTFLQ